LSFLFLFCRLGHVDHEITAAFSRFDKDGNHILDEEEQQQMKHDLEAKRVKQKKGGGVGKERNPLFGRDDSKVASGIFEFVV